MRTDERAHKQRRHAIVDSVSEGPAAAAGVASGDLILAVNGDPISRGGRAEATAKITSAPMGMMTLSVARHVARRRRVAAATGESVASTAAEPAKQHQQPRRGRWPARGGGGGAGGGARRRCP